MTPEELAAQYTQLHNRGQHEEANQLAIDTLEEQNLTPKYDGSGTWTFVDANQYENGFYS